MEYRSVCILGGTGFVGGHICSRLVDQGFRVRVLTREREANRHLSVLPGLELVQADVYDREALVQHLEGFDVSINLVGLLNQTRKQTFRQAHVELTLRWVQACRTAGVKRLLHMSALNADFGNGPSEYLRTKGEAENVLHLATRTVRYTIFQPSVIFGPDDSFINRFASLLRIAPLWFPLACPDARFAPVYVGDVADAFVKSINARDAVGQRFQLCGPRSYTLIELVRMIRDYAGRRTPYITGLNDLFSRVQAAVLGLVPGKPFSLDNYRSMQQDSVCREDGLKRLGIEPTPLEGELSAYVNPQDPKSRLNQFRRFAGR